MRAAKTPVLVPAKGGSLLLHLTVFVSGAAVMVVEIVGTRALAPVFGAGLFVWAALLAVTLCALAIGYYTGGAFADRRPVPRSLGLALGIAGCALTLSVPCAPVLLRWGLLHGPRIGSLVTASLLFGPALTALGTVGPIAVRLATTDVQFTGHRVGRAYALSTAGSLLGTLVVVFVLIPAVETNVILLGTAGLLLLNSAPWLRRGERIAALLLAIVPALLTDSSSRTLPGDLRIAARAQSPYGLLEVIDDASRGIRLLRSDHSIIGGSRADGTGVFAYTHVLEVLRFARPAATEMLQIGLGTGTLAMAMQRRGVHTDVVEIDPEVVRLAKAYFGYVDSGSLTIEDARTFLNRTSSTYDLIVHDTFTGGATPAHLLSQDVLSRLRSLLRPGGILVVNLPGFAHGPHADASHALARTMREVFPEVRVFRDAAPEPGPAALSNLLYFASDGAMDLDVPESTRFEHEACERALTRFTRWEVLETARPGPLVTDARNPLTWMQIPIAEAHYQAMNKLLPAQAWLPW